MWNYNLFPTEQVLLENVSKHSKIAGIILTIIGLLSFVYPFYASIVTVSIVAWFMIFAGITTAFFTFRTNSADWLGWLKTLILIGTGFLIIFYPKIGIATVGLLFAIYFMLDGFVGLALSASMRPNIGWWVWSLNGIISVALGVLFLVSWNSISQEAWIIGIYIGISLFFDGITLLFLGNKLTKI